MRKETANWLAGSDYDLTTAEHMFKSGRFLYVVFMCHLAMEKALKAIVHDETGKLPPKTHDLIYLSGLAAIRFPEDIRDFVGKINSASVVARYPEDIAKVVASYTEDIAGEYLNKTKETLQWLRQDARLRR